MGFFTDSPSDNAVDLTKAKQTLHTAKQNNKIAKSNQQAAEESYNNHKKQIKTNITNDPHSNPNKKYTDTITTLSDNHTNDIKEKNQEISNLKIEEQEAQVAKNKKALDTVTKAKQDYLTDLNNAKNPEDTQKAKDKYTKTLDTLRNDPDYKDQYSDTTNEELLENIKNKSNDDKELLEEKKEKKDELEKEKKSIDKEYEKDVAQADKDRESDIEEAVNEDESVQQKKDELDEANNTLDTSNKEVSEATEAVETAEDDQIETSGTVTEIDDGIFKATNEITGESHTFSSKAEAEAWATNAEAQNATMDSNAENIASAYCEAQQADPKSPSQQDLISAIDSTYGTSGDDCDPDALEEKIKEQGKTPDGRLLASSLSDLADDVTPIEEEEPDVTPPQQVPPASASDTIGVGGVSNGTNGSLVVGPSTSFIPTDYTGNSTETNNEVLIEGGDREIILGTSKFICENLQPIYKHSYVCNFSDPDLEILNWHVKEVDRPKHDIEVIKQLRANVERIYPIKYTHSTLTLTFWDDVKRLTVMVLHNYMRKHALIHNDVHIGARKVLKDNALQEKMVIYDFGESSTENSIIKYTYWNVLITSYDYDSNVDDDDDGFNVTVQFEFENYKIEPANLDEIDKLNELRNKEPACLGKHSNIPESTLNYTVVATDGMGGTPGFEFTLGGNSSYKWNNNVINSATVETLQTDIGTINNIQENDLSKMANLLSGNNTTTQSINSINNNHNTGMGVNALSNATPNYARRPGTNIHNSTQATNNIAHTTKLKAEKVLTHILQDTLGSGITKSIKKFYKS